MFFPPTKACDKCKTFFEEGDRIRRVTVGTIKPVGGLGIYRASLIFRIELEGYIHEGECPSDKGRRRA